MAVTINASLSAGLVQTADTSGDLNLQSGGTTRLAVTSTGVAVTGTLSASGVSTFAAGSAAAPSIAPTGDSNTGIFFPAADTIAFSEGGVESMRIDSSANLTVTGSATIQGLTVGKGGSAVLTNTAVGVTALTSNTTGSANVAIGYQAAYLNAGGSNNTTLGGAAAFSNVSGSNNTAIGNSALQSNTAGSNTAVGYQSLYTNVTGVGITALGYRAGYLYNTNGTDVYGSLFVGYSAGGATTSGINNCFVGSNTAVANTTGSSNTSLGAGSLFSNTTASYNTAVGYQAGYTNSTGEAVTYIGQNAGKFTTGGYNSFFGQSAGSDVTSGAKNTIVGRYNGNQSGLDIRTASNYIVLSDGDGNPMITSTTNNNGSSAIGNGAGGVAGLASLTVVGYGGSGQIAGGRNSLYMRNGNPSGNQSNFIVFGSAGTASSCFIGNDVPATGAVTTLVVQSGGSGGVQLTSGATSWTSASDERLKNVTGTYTNALADIAKIKPVKFTWKSDEDNNPQVGVIAQSVEGVVPEAVTKGRLSAEDETEYLSVKYTELIPLLIASIQELKAEIDLLKGVK